MIDSGSGPNLIKIRSVNPSTKINQNEVLLLRGITTQQVLTIGQVEVNVLGQFATFHVVDNGFPISQEGIIGSDFLVQRKACINFGNKRLEYGTQVIPFESEERLIIPARSRTQAYVIVTNPERLEGIEGVYFGDALITVNDSKAHLEIVNTNHRDFEIIIPKIKILEVSSIRRNKNSESQNHMCKFPKSQENSPNHSNSKSVTYDRTPEDPFKPRLTKSQRT
ncbi:hypothetical protein WH47_10938 [Habropoda laboriosa]|uniref:Uncharacterized protein n=1 Tax=Habropoda laboriosa TaxID=597456 RepID=A0A0L7QKG5_9HYME|nr:hypothetical protein WH47_10938 [Habropoda laboriosa]